MHMDKYVIGVIDFKSKVIFDLRGSLEDEVASEEFMLLAPENRHPAMRHFSNISYKSVDPPILTTFPRIRAALLGAAVQGR